MSSSSAPQKKNGESSGVISKAIAKITAPKKPKPLFQVDDRVQDKKTREPYIIEYRICERRLSEFTGRWEYKRQSYTSKQRTGSQQIVDKSDWIEEHDLKEHKT